MRARSAVVGLVVLLVAAGACGGDDADEIDPVTTTTAPPSTESSTGSDDDPATVAPGVFELALASDDTVPAGPHIWALELRNITDAPVDVVFPTSQQGDVVLRRDGEVVHRWSDGRFFAQQVIEETIPPDAALPIALDDDLSGLEPGTYEAELTTTARGTVEPVVTSVRVVSP